MLQKCDDSVSYECIIRFGPNTAETEIKDTNNQYEIAYGESNGTWPTTSRDPHISGRDTNMLMAQYLEMAGDRRSISKHNQ